MKKKQVILLVDDNRNFANRMVGLLEETNCVSRVNLAGNYDEALRSLASEIPDVILLDINLPGKNGIEILKHIKEINLTCEVIMITNHADSYYKNLCEELGAKHFLDKSNDFNLVPSLISDFVMEN